MSSQIYETILESFRDVSNGAISTNGANATSWVQPAAVEPVATQFQQAARQLAGAGTAQSDAIAANTRAVLSATKTAAGAPPESGGVNAGTIASTILKSGLGVIPLISGLLGLFSGGAEEAPTPLTRYTPPQPLHVNAAQWGGIIGSADYGQTGALRPFVTAELSSAAFSPAAGNLRPAEPIAESRVPIAPVVNVQVQAMDSQSFLDHSQEITRAVRDAMLNLNAINDVVNDL